jgi:hypothetical protein
VQSNVVPKVLTMMALMAAASAAAGGGDDDEDKKHPWRAKAGRAFAKIPGFVTAGRILRKVPAYDLLQYIVVPLGTDEKGNAVAWRLPQDENGRFVGGVVAKLLAFASGDEGFWRTMTGLTGYTFGQLPSVSPAITAGTAAVSYASGNNIFDPFREKLTFTPDEMKARDYSWQPFRKFVGWEFQQLGGGIIWKFYPGDERPKQQTTAQAWLDSPVISNTLGRYLKITKYGEVERSLRVKQQEQGKESARRLDEQQAVNETLTNYFTLPPGQQNVRTQAKLAAALAKQLYPTEKDPDDQAATQRRLERRIAMSVVHGQDDTLAEVVIGAGTNAAKIAVILKARPDYTDEQLTNWLKAAVRQDVISPQVMIDVQAAVAKQRKGATIH